MAAGAATTRGAATWVPDGRFGRVLTCNASGRGHAVLPSVPYANEGPFSVGVWCVRVQQGAGCTWLQVVATQVLVG